MEGDSTSEQPGISQVATTETQAMEDSMTPETSKDTAKKPSWLDKFKEKINPPQIGKKVTTLAVAGTMALGAAAGADVSPVSAQGEGGPGQPSSSEEWEPADQNEGEERPNQNGPHQKGRLEDPGTVPSESDSAVSDTEKQKGKPLNEYEIHLPIVMTQGPIESGQTQQTVQKTIIKEGVGRKGEVNPFPSEQGFPGKQQNAYKGNPSSKPIIR